MKIDKTKIKKQGFTNYLMNQYILNYSKDKYIFVSYGKLLDTN